MNTKIWRENIGQILEWLHVPEIRMIDQDAVADLKHPTIELSYKDSQS